MAVVPSVLKPDRRYRALGRNRHVRQSPSATTQAEARVGLPIVAWESICEVQRALTGTFLGTISQIGLDASRVSL
jgi:hypothetical protein